MRSKGISVEWIAKRSVLFFVLTSAVTAPAILVVGLGMWLGLLPGSQKTPITRLPALVALAAILGTLAVAGWARRAARRRSSEGSRTVVVLSVIGGVMEDLVALIRRHDWRLVGQEAWAEDA